MEMEQHVQQRGILVKPAWKVMRFAPVFELFILSLDLALIFQSFLAFLVATAIFLTVYPLKELRILFFAMGWGIVGCWIGFMFDSTAGMIILSILFFFTSFGVHIFGLEDLLDAEK